MNIETRKQFMRDQNFFRFDYKSIILYNTPSLDWAFELDETECNKFGLQLDDNSTKKKITLRRLLLTVCDSSGKSLIWSIDQPSNDKHYLIVGQDAINIVRKEVHLILEHIRTRSDSDTIAGSNNFYVDGFEPGYKETDYAAYDDIIEQTLVRIEEYDKKDSTVNFPNRIKRKPKPNNNNSYRKTAKLYAEVLTTNEMKAHGYNPKPPLDQKPSSHSTTQQTTSLVLVPPKDLAAHNSTTTKSTTTKSSTSSTTKSTILPPNHPFNSSQALVQAPSQSMVPAVSQELTLQLQNAQIALANYDKKYQQLEQSTTQRFEELDRKLSSSQATTKTLFTKVTDLSQSVQDSTKKMDTKLESSLRPLQSAIANLDSSLDQRINNSLASGPIGSSLGKIDALYELFTSNMKQHATSPIEPSLVTGPTESSTISTLTAASPPPGVDFSSYNAAPNPVPMSPTPTQQGQCSVLTEPSRNTSTTSTQSSQASAPSISVQIKQEMIDDATPPTLPPSKPPPQGPDHPIYLDTSPPPTSESDEPFIPVGPFNKSPSKDYDIERYNHDKIKNKRSPIGTRSAKNIQSSHPSQSNISRLTPLGKTVSSHPSTTTATSKRKSVRSSSTKSSGASTRRSG